MFVAGENTLFVHVGYIQNRLDGKQMKILYRFKIFLLDF